MNLLEQAKSGWTYPPRAQKAHFFESTNETGSKAKSACGKYNINWSNGPAYVPMTAFQFSSEQCAVCCKALLASK